MFASSEESVAQKPPSDIPACSRRIPPRRGTSPSRQEALRPFGKGVIMGIMYASTLSAPMQPRISQKSNRYAATWFRCKRALRVVAAVVSRIVIWKRLSHPNVLPVLGVSPKLFPLCVITEWMVDGNTVGFASKHPEVNHHFQPLPPPQS